MKSIEELIAIRDKMRSKVILRHESDGVHVAVCMGTSGIAAGARAVLNTLVEAVYDLGLGEQVTVIQKGSSELCGYEPVVEVFENGKDKITYINMTAEKALRVAEEHLRGGKPVAEFMLNGDRSMGGNDK